MKCGLESDCVYRYAIDPEGSMTAPATKIQRMDAGLCYGCGDRPPARGKRQCDECLRKQGAMWRHWRDRKAEIERDEAQIRAEALAMPSEGGPPDPTDDPGVAPGIELIATGKNVVRVCGPDGKPTLAILPWGDYRNLMREAASGGRKSRGRGRPRKEPDLQLPRGSRPEGRPPVAGAHILRELIRDHPASSAAEIAEMFLERTGVSIHRNTVNRYRKITASTTAQAEPASKPGKPGLVVNGVDLGEYDQVILDAAIRAGARPETARESEQYADGLVALYEAAEDFGAGGGSFIDYAASRIRLAISRGNQERKVTVKGKSGRVLNFSEIGGEDFDIAELIDDSYRLH